LLPGLRASSMLKAWRVLMCQPKPWAKQGKAPVKSLTDFDWQQSCSRVSAQTERRCFLISLAGAWGLPAVGVSAVDRQGSLVLVECCWTTADYVAARAD